MRRILFSFPIDVPVKAQLDRLSVESGQSRAAIVREAIEQHLQRCETVLPEVSKATSKSGDAT